MHAGPDKWQIQLDLTHQKQEHKENKQRLFFYVPSECPMPAPLISPLSTSELSISEADIDALLSEFGNDPRAAIRALLHDLAILAEDRDSSVSYGYVRGRLYAKETVVRNSER